MRRLLALMFGSLRLGLAALLVFLCWQDHPAAVAAAQFESLPSYDFAAQARTLLGQERYSEALLVIDAGVTADPAQAAQLGLIRTEVETERDRLLRRVEDAGRGALTGRGDSAESLAGAVTADLFVFGDVRDLVIQSGNALTGEDVDEVIVALSAAGIVLTVAPQLDLGAALLKFARRAGALTARLARELMDLARAAVRERSAAPLAEALGDAASLGRSARPAAAMAILHNVDDVSDLRRAAQAARQPGGAFALWLGGRDSLAWLRASGPAGEALLVRAAGKGPAGIAFIGRKGALLLQVHPLLGVAKGLYKGNVPALVSRLFEPRSRQLLLAASAVWLVLELFLLAVLLAPRGRRRVRPEAAR
jgi:hypothetical protein